MKLTIEGSASDIQKVLLAIAGGEEHKESAAKVAEKLESYLSSLDKVSINTLSE